MDPSTRNTVRPSAIPRLTKLSITKPSILSSTLSKEDLNSPKINSATLHSSRLRHSVSHDESSLSSNNRIPSSPRISGTGPQTYRISSSPLLYTERSCSRYISQDFLLTKPTEKLQDKELEPSDSKHSIVLDVSESHDPQTTSSLSGRAIETLHNIQYSPVLRKKDSRFFNSVPDSILLSRRNSSSASASISNSHATLDCARSPKDKLQFSKPSNSCVAKTSSLKLRSPKNHSTTNSGLKISTPRNPASPLDQKSPNYLKLGSRKIAGLSPESKISSPSLLQKPSASSPYKCKDDSSNSGRKKKLSTSTESTGILSSSRISKETPIPRTNITNQTAHQKSSLTLRDHIAKAKAAKHAVTINEADYPQTTPSVSFELTICSDPFNQKFDKDDAKELLKRRIHSAQTDGRLNISAMGLKEMPSEVLKMYNLEDLKDISWSEMVDLTRLNASDNEFEALPDDMFPDIGPRESSDDEDVTCCQFCGLEIIDLRENKLTNLPLGLRRLELLTTLNLVGSSLTCIFPDSSANYRQAGNQLTNDCFHVISQIVSLRDLTLERNCLTGELDTKLGSLKNLISLNIRQNKISNLPSSIRELVQLRILNVTQNQLEELPFHALGNLPLTEILAAKNKLGGTLFPDVIDVLPDLQILDVTSNFLTSLHSTSKIRLPSLQKLLCPSNRITNLPNMTSWSSLLTIDAEDNCIETLPVDLVELPMIKSINFNGNKLRLLDNRLGRLESLDILHISGNPLQEKKFASMSMDNLKTTLLSRLELESEDDKEKESQQIFYSAHESPPQTIPASPLSQKSTSSRTSSNNSNWIVQGSGVLDRSNTQSHSLNPVAAAEIAVANKINILQLDHNNFSVIPESIAFFASTLTTLDLSHNELTSDTYLKDDLELPKLKELNLSSNTIDSLQPICQHLKSPNLTRLDISFNRLSSLPVLRNYFPILTTLLTSHNTIKELLPDSIKNMHSVDCSSNEINSLNAKIGLLGGPDGLRYLDVRGNRFKVPKYTILEKGTEATLIWLRDRIPASELTSSDGEEPVD